jgi:hypothetical protein
MAPAEANDCFAGYEYRLSDVPSAFYIDPWSQWEDIPSPGAEKDAC